LLVRERVCGQTAANQPSREFPRFTMSHRKQTLTLDWEDLRFFAVLARRRTVAATARDLNVTRATVSRRLTNLEATLGIRLFTRRAGTYSLNAEGATTLAEAAQMEMAACSLLCRSRVAERTANANAPQGRAAGACVRGRRS
jgi:DNA-binding transcriptional LysR family regulator